MAVPTRRWRTVAPSPARAGALSLRLGPISSQRGLDVGSSPRQSHPSESRDHGGDGCTKGLDHQAGLPEANLPRRGGIRQSWSSQAQPMAMTARSHGGGPPVPDRRVPVLAELRQPRNPRSSRLATPLGSSTSPSPDSASSSCSWQLPGRPRRTTAGRPQMVDTARSWAVWVWRLASYSTFWLTHSRAAALGPPAVDQAAQRPRPLHRWARSCRPGGHRAALL
jgi:hypothetical protein